MQKTRKAYVIKCDFNWDDIGSFGALVEFLVPIEITIYPKMLY